MARRPERARVRRTSVCAPVPRTWASALAAGTRQLATASVSPHAVKMGFVVQPHGGAVLRYAVREPSPSGKASSGGQAVQERAQECAQERGQEREQGQRKPRGSIASLRSPSEARSPVSKGAQALACAGQPTSGAALIPGPAPQDDKAGRAASKRERRRLVDATEAPVIRLIATSLWKLASGASDGEDALTIPSDFDSSESQSSCSDSDGGGLRRRRGGGGPDPDPELLRPFVSGGSKPGSAAQFGHFLAKVVKNLNDFDIEVSCENRFRVTHSLGLRILLCAIVLLDRLLARLPGARVSPRTLQRLVLSAMLCVSKFSEDEPLNNEFWAQVAAMQVRELNRCELAMVQILEYNVRVSEEVFEGLLERFGALLVPAAA